MISLFFHMNMNLWSVQINIITVYCALMVLKVASKLQKRLDNMITILATFCHLTAQFVSNIVKGPIYSPQTTQS